MCVWCVIVTASGQYYWYFLIDFVGQKRKEIPTVVVKIPVVFTKQLYVKLLQQYLTSCAYQEIQTCNCFMLNCIITIYLLTVYIVFELCSLCSILCAHSQKDESTRFPTTLLLDHSEPVNMRLLTHWTGKGDIWRIHTSSAAVYLNCKPLLLLWVTSIL